MIISASRRTDIPCYYSEWFLNRLRDGYALIPNPRNTGRLGRIMLSPQNVDCIVFWTKNPAPMMDRLTEIDEMGYSYYFEFTVTAYGKDMEPNLPEKETLIDTFQALSERLGPKRVDWRFDPIIQNDRFSAEWIAEQFDRLCAQLGGYTERCIISFVDAYTHIKNRDWFLSREEMFDAAARISEIAAKYHLPVYTCSEEINLRELGIKPASCIDQGKIEQIIGCRITAGKDTGQRQSCGCIESVDVGAYDTCENGCAYCYATTSKETIQRRRREHDPGLPLLTGRPRGTEIVTDRTGVSLKTDQISLFE